MIPFTRSADGLNRPSAPLRLLMPLPNMNQCPGLLLSLIAHVFFTSTTLGQQAGSTPPALGSNTNLPIREISKDQIQIGKVILDKKARTISIPTVVNMDRPPLEYFLVTATGKLHESLLKTEADPLHIHVAMLLLGAKGAMSADPALFHDPKSEIPGDKVSISVSWIFEDRKVVRKAEELIFNLETKSAMTPGTWTYNGSRMVDGQFVAQKEGSVLSLMADPYALINNPRPGRENDEIWTVMTNAVPKVDTAVELTLKIEDPPQPKKQP